MPSRQVGIRADSTMRWPACQPTW